MQPLELLQPAQGYRYNIDSMLLARFACFREGEEICDLGAGVGILAILSLLRGRAKKAWAIEVQEELFEYLSKNQESLGLKSKLKTIRCNWKEVKNHLSASSIDLVISNPPYRKSQSGKTPKEKIKAIAKQEIEGSLPDLLKAARFLLKPKGRMAVIYPCARLEDFMAELQAQKLKIQRLCYVHPFEDRPATHFMAEIVRSVAGEILVESPVIIYEDEEHYRPEIEAWLGSKKRKVLSSP